MRSLVTEIVEFRDDFRVVGTAANGVEALERVSSLAPDIVTLDLAMPQMDGLAALERIMKEMPRPVIIVSAAESANFNAAAVRALELGAVEFVRKPSGPVSVTTKWIPVVPIGSSGRLGYARVPPKVSWAPTGRGGANPSVVTGGLK